MANTVMNTSATLKMAKLNSHLEHVLHVAVDNAVDAVSQTARGDEHKAPAGNLTGDEVRCQCDDDKHGEHAGGNDEIDARAAAAQEAEGSPVIMDVHKTNDAGDEFDDIGAEQGVLDPVLHCLIQNDDKQADY